MLLLSKFGEEFFLVFFFNTSQYKAKDLHKEDGYWLMFYERR